MKILQITYESFGSPFGFGGAGVRAYEIYRRLQDRHRITFLCMRYPGAKDGDIQGIDHIFAGSESRSLTVSVLAYTLKAAEFVRKHGGDFDVIVENFLPSTPFFSKFLTGTPVILQVQGIMEGHVLRKFRFYHSFPMYLSEKFYPGLYDRFIFVSPVTQEKVMTGVKGKVRQCHMIPNGVDKALLQTAPVAGDYILFFSRIDTYTKGLDLLLSAFSRLAPSFPRLELVMAGYEFDPAEKLIARLEPSLRSRVRYAGFLSGKAKRDLLAGAAVVVLPSRHESAPISILEAAACGKPLVVSNIRELKFVAGNGLGLEFSSGVAEELRESLELVLKNPELRTELGSRGREYAERFLWDSVAAEFENALQLARDENR
jgi:glycosyltransferase involved in cell wall biosynthesis